MSPEDFRKMSHPEPKILNSLVNSVHTDTQKHRHTDKCRSRAVPPTVSQLKTPCDINH